MFSGEIPFELGTLYLLNDLDFSYNKLTGSIPGNLFTRQHLNLAYNSLNGPIPQGFFSAFNLETFLGNKDLCSDDYISGFPQCF